MTASPLWRGPALSLLALPFLVTVAMTTNGLVMLYMYETAHDTRHARRPPATTGLGILSALTVEPGRCDPAH